MVTDRSPKRRQLERRGQCPSSVNLSSWRKYAVNTFKTVTADSSYRPILPFHFPEMSTWPELQYRVDLKIYGRLMIRMCQCDFHKEYTHTHSCQQCIHWHLAHMWVFVCVRMCAYHVLDAWSLFTFQRAWNRCAKAHNMQFWRQHALDIVVDMFPLVLQGSQEIRKHENPNFALLCILSLIAYMLCIRVSPKE